MTTKVTINETPQSADDLARAEAELTRALQRDGQTPNTGHDDQYRAREDRENIQVWPRANTAREQWVDMDGSHGGGKESVRGVRRANVTDLRPDSTGSVLDTLRTTYGDPKPVSQATSDDVVIHNGMEISLGVAEQIGLLAKDSNGQYYDPRVGIPGTDRYHENVEAHEMEKAEQAENSTANALRSVDPGHNAYLGQEAEQTLATLVRADASLTGDLVASAINALSQGEQPAFDYNAIAEAMGKPGNTAAGQAAVAKVVTALNEQAHDIFQAAGAYDVDQALDWTRKSMPSQFRDAIAKQAEGDISGLQNLAHQYSTSGANVAPTDTTANPDDFSDEELVEHLAPNVPSGTEVYMRGHVAYIKSPEIGDVPLRTVLETTGRLYWG